MYSYSKKEPTPKKEFLEKKSILKNKADKIHLNEKSTNDAIINNADDAEDSNNQNDQLDTLLKLLFAINPQLDSKSVKSQKKKDISMINSLSIGNLSKKNLNTVL